MRTGHGLGQGWVILLWVIGMLSLPTFGDVDEMGGGGDFDFGDSGPAEDPMASVDVSSPTYALFEEALSYSAQGRHDAASLLFFEVVKTDDATGRALRPQVRYELGRSLFQLGYYQSALSQFELVLQYGPRGSHYLPTLQWLVLISRELPGEPNRYQRVYDNFLDMFPMQIDPSLMSEVGLLMGQAAYQSSMLDDAIFFFGNVEESSALYPRARFIEGVTFVRKYNGQEAVESFKEVLRWLDKKEVLTADEVRLREATIASLGRVFYQVGHGLWAQGERPRAVNMWNTAIKYYASFSQSSPMWLDALFEASWTYYRVDNFSKALGLLLTLNSPFFNDKYYPEAMLLQAQIYYTNCHYDRVMYILDEFKDVYPPLKRELDSLLTTLFQPEEVYDFLRSVEREGKDFDPTAQQVLNAALQDRELKRMLAYIDALDDEMDRIKKAGKGWSSHDLAKTLEQDLQFTKRFASVEAGKKAKTRLERVADELGRLNNMALDIEIETTEKFAQRIGVQEQDPNALLEFEREISARMAADNEHLYWTFDGEYWRDELGYYWYHISSRCGR